MLTDKGKRSLVARGEGEGWVKWVKEFKRYKLPFIK